MPRNYPIHILVRYSDKLGNVEDTIREHQDVIEKKGAVWFGKVGKPLSQRRIDQVNKQVEEGKTSFLILVQNLGHHYDVYRAKTMQASRSLPSDEESFVPTYYFEHNLMRNIAFWVKTSEIEHVDSEYLSRLSSVSSFTRIPETLARSMAGMFIVREKVVVP